MIDKAVILSAGLGSRMIEPNSHAELDAKQALWDSRLKNTMPTEARLQELEQRYKRIRRTSMETTSFRERGRLFKNDQ